jgi:hypothetical protein
MILLWILLAFVAFIVFMAITSRVAAISDSDNMCIAAVEGYLMVIGYIAAILVVLPLCLWWVLNVLVHSPNMVAMLVIAMPFIIICIAYYFIYKR